VREAKRIFEKFSSEAIITQRDRIKPGEKVPAGTRCAFCKLDEGSVDRELTGALVGPFAMGLKDVWVHQYCCELCPDVILRGKKWYNVISSLETSRKARCHHCKKLGASIRCLDKACNVAYHLPCAAKHTHWDFGDHRPDQGKQFFCRTHRLVKGTSDPAAIIITHGSPPPDASESGCGSVVKDEDEDRLLLGHEDPLAGGKSVVLEFPASRPITLLDASTQLPVFRA
jgi:hypothetical protein